MPTRRTRPRHGSSGPPVARPLTYSPRQRTRKPERVISNVERPASGRSLPRRGAGAHSVLVDAKRKRSRRKVVLIALILTVLVGLAAAGVSAFTFFRSTDSNLALDPSNVQEALVAQKADEPYFVLMTADLSLPGYAKQQPNAQGYQLVRIDEGARTVTLITIPSKLNVRTSDGETRPLDEAKAVGGDAELVRVVSELIGEGIAHFVTTDSAGISGMADALGGVPVELVSQIDDPTTGYEVVDAGASRLSGSQSLAFLRASNVAGGVDGMFQDRMTYTLNLAKEAASSQGLSFANAVGEASRFIYTDWTASDLLALGSALSPFDGLTIYTCIFPYVSSNAAGVGNTLYERRSQSWDQMLARIKAGQDPNDIETESASVEANGVTVEVRNGTNTAGAAAKLGEMLTQDGYEVIGVGNTDDNTIYPETLVIYTKSEYEGEAKAVLDDMGSGRLVNGGDFYSSDAHVIAIIGLDWMPVD